MKLTTITLTLCIPDDKEKEFLEGDTSSLYTEVVYEDGTVATWPKAAVASQGYGIETILLTQWACTKGPPDGLRIKIS